MATLNARANTFGTTSGSTWSTTANAVDGVFGATNNTYATFTSLVASATGYIEVGFGTQLSSGIPANATGISVSVTIRHLETNVTTMPTVRFQPYDGATAIGSLASGTANTANHANTTVFTPTIGQLRSATFKIRVTCTRNASTTAGNFSLDNVDVVVTYTVPKASTLVEPFTASVDPAAWYSYGTTGWSAGQATITESLSYSGILSIGGLWDLTESSVFAKVTPPAVFKTSSESAMFFRTDANNGLWFQVVTWDGGATRQLIMRHRTASTNSDTNVAYDPVAHAWWRFRLSGTTAYWDTSPDGVTWTNLRSATITLTLTAAQLEFSAGQWQTESAQGVLYVDNVNVPGTAAASGRPKVWTGAAWSQKPAKVWSGTAWVEKPTKVWTGSVWKTVL